jgi:glycosyltransferase involved in cell wall biosynthesis
MDASGWRLSHVSAPAPAVSVVISTYNRSVLLGGALESVLRQDTRWTPPFEVLVVDNNSTDGTRDVVDRVAARDPRVRYLFEPQQGLSHARNTGIAAARAPIVTFTDDDVRAEPGWVRAIARTFEEHPDADFAGGKVLPRWPCDPPAWLTREHWAPLALVDYGDAPLWVTSDRSICLVGANLSVRRAAFEAVGIFTPALQRVKGGTGSLEDHEFQLRLIRQGRCGIYDPRILVHAEVELHRLTRAYHRRWHYGHGHFHALLRAEYLERSRAGTLWGVPVHLYRQAVADGVAWMAASVRHGMDEAFRRETRLWFFAGFVITRRRQFREMPDASLWREVGAAVRALFARRRASGPIPEGRQ